MSIRSLLTIGKQELKGFLDRPAGYVLLALFAGLVSFLFYRSAFITGEATLRPMFATLPWILLFFIPAITMRLLAEEEHTGTIELLLTQPITELDVVAGKFKGGGLIVALALATTLTIPITLATAGSLDWGVVFSQYLAALLLAGSMVGIGLFASSLTKNQVLASITAAVISFFGIILGFELITLSVPRQVAEVLTAISLLSHFETMTRGVIDLRDVLYFASVMFLFGMGAYLVLHAKRTNRKADEFYNLQLGAILLVGITVAANMLVAPYAIRLDLTANRLFTLSPATKKIIQESPDDLTITLFASRNLPAQVSSAYRDVRDLLRDYAAASNGKVTLVEKYPDIDQQAAQQAEALGVQPVQFNVMEQEQFSVQQGWLGIAMQAGTEHESIPFVQQADDLEYQVTSLILKLEGAERSTVAFIEGHNEKTAQDLAALRGELEKQYEVTDVSPGEKGGLDLKGVRVAVVAGPQTPYEGSELVSLDKFIKAGGKVYFMLDGYTINQQFLLATPTEDNLSELTMKYGVDVPKELLYDLQSNEAVSFSDGQNQYQIPYPFWARMRADAPAVVGDIDSAVLPWPSPVTVSETGTPKGAQVIPILATSEAAGVESGQPSIAPDREWQPDEASLKQYIGGVAVQGPSGDKAWRIAVVGDADFATDAYAQNAPESVIMALNTIDWLAQDDALSGIRTKSSSSRQLRFDSYVQQVIISWGNVLGIPLLIAGIGTWHLVRRRRRARRGDAR